MCWCTDVNIILPCVSFYRCCLYMHFFCMVSAVFYFCTHCVTLSVLRSTCQDWGRSACRTSMSGSRSKRDSEERRYGPPLFRFSQHRRMRLLGSSLTVCVLALIGLCVSVRQRRLRQPGVQRGGRAEEKEDRGFKGESALENYATFRWRQE